MAVDLQISALRGGDLQTTIETTTSTRHPREGGDRATLSSAAEPDRKSLGPRLRGDDGQTNSSRCPRIASAPTSSKPSELPSSQSCESTCVRSSFQSSLRSS